MTLTNGSNNIYIGNSGDESQTIRIGTAQTQTFMAGTGIVGIPIANALPVEIDISTGQLGTGSLSSARYKRDIAPMGTSSEKVLDLRPVTFAYRNDAQAVRHYGLVPRMWQQCTRSL